jgi:hypothetical protein
MDILFSKLLFLRVSDIKSEPISLALDTPFAATRFIKMPAHELETTRA